MLDTLENQEELQETETIEYNQEIDNEIVEEIEDDQETDELDEGETPEDEAAEDDQEDEIVITIDGESATPTDDEQQETPEWVRETRRVNRELKKEIKALKSKLETKPAEQQAITLGAKPTLESCDYDAEKLSSELDVYYNKKIAYDKQQAEVEQEQKKQAQAWEAKLNSYNTKKAALKVRDFDDVEEVVRDNFDVTKQSIILTGSEDPAKVVYAIGSNASIAKKLSEIKDPIEFAFAVARLETKIKSTTRKASTQPERTVSNSSVNKAGNAKLKQLEAQAEKTGDFTALMAYKRKLRGNKHG